MNKDIIKELKIAIDNNDEVKLQDNLFLIHKSICDMFHVPYARDIQILHRDVQKYGVYNHETHNIGIKMPTAQNPYTTYSLSYEQEDLVYNLINTISHETYHHVQSFKNYLIEHDKQVEENFLLQYKLSKTDFFLNEMKHSTFNKLYCTKEFSARLFALNYTQDFYKEEQNSTSNNRKYIDSYLKAYEYYYLQNNLVNLDELSETIKQIANSKSYAKTTKYKLTNNQVDEYFQDMRRTLSGFHNDLADIVRDIKHLLVQKNIPMSELNKLSDKELIVLYKDSIAYATMSKQEKRYAKIYIHFGINKKDKIKIAYTLPKFKNYLDMDNDLQK